VASRCVGEAYKVQVMLPVREPGTVASYPVVYVTDGNLHFDVLRGIAYNIQASQSSAPRFILVGIGYPGESRELDDLRRGRDMIFEGYPNVESTSRRSFGAENFQQFIGQELIPFIDERYPTVIGDRTYFGHSLGGGFGLFTLFTRDALFRNYIISSPGLTYSGESPSGDRYDNYDFLLQRARDFIVAGRSLESVRLYMSVGTEEEFEVELVQWQLTSSFYRMVKVLRASPIMGLALNTEAFPNETHATAWPISFVHGIRAIFEPRCSQV
jgi:predicted alpha/beta superfamily hydrolase